MGSKGNDAPAPDPALVAKQIESMGIQDTVIKKIMENSDTMLPLQKQQLQFGLDSAKKAYDQSQDDREWTLGRRDKLTQAQDKIIGQSESFNEEARGDELAGRAAADVNQAFDSAAAQRERGMSRMGVNPSSGQAIASSDQMALQKALATAKAGTDARTVAHGEGMALTDRAVNTMAGYPAMGMNATTQGAGIGTSGVGLTGASVAGMNSGFGLAGNVAGSMGSNASGMYGAQANYAVNSGQADASASAGLGTAIGGIAMAI